MEKILYENIKNEILEEDLELLKLMAHPIRLKIIDELTKNKMLNVTQVAKILDIPQSTTSQHLSKLKKIALLTERRKLEVYYYIHNLKARKIIELLKQNR